VRGRVKLRVEPGIGGAGDVLAGRRDARDASFRRGKAGESPIAAFEDW
jgi:hypothetical protein